MLPKIATSPVLWLPLTVGVYWIASELYRLLGRSPLLNPTLLTIVALCGALIGLKVPYAAYFESVGVLNYLLGTAVVALAIPLYRNLRSLVRELPLITLALVAGSLTSILCGLAFAKAFGVTPSMLLSLAPKSATAAVSMEIA